MGPPADCSPVDEAWLETAPRCGRDGYYAPSTAPDCQVIDGNLDLYHSGQTALPEFTRFRAVLGVLSLGSAYLLTDLSGLRNLEHLGNFGISGAPVTSLEGLANLRTVTNSVSIGRMPVLTSLEGLESLRFIGGDLLIYENGAMTALRGLDSLCRVGGNLQIADNAVLAQAELEAFLDRIEVAGEVIVMNPGP